LDKSSFKNPSPSYNTSGAGLDFEHKVEAIFLTHLLTETIPFDFNKRINEISFQLKEVPSGIDDFSVLFDDESKAYGQIRHKMTVGKNEKFKEFLQSCIELLKNPFFERDKDFLVLIIGKFNQSLSSHFINLIQCAKTSKDYHEFKQRIMMKQVYGDKARQYLQIISDFFFEIDNTISQDLTHIFLQHFKIIQVSLDKENNADEINAQNNLAIKYQINPSEASLIFNALKEIAFSLSTNSARISGKELRLTMYEKFPNMTIQIENDLLELDGYLNRNEINTYLVFVGRRKELNQIDDFIKDNKKKVLIIYGKGGTGKTRLCLEYLKNVQDRKIYFFHINTNIDRVSFSKSSIYVIDDAIKYDILRIMDFIKNLKDIKIILIDRNEFRIRIENDFFLSNNKPEELEKLKMTDPEINDFLDKNYSGLPQNIKNSVISNCKNSYTFAIMLAKYYTNSTDKKITDIISLIKFELTKYANSLKINYNYNPNDIFKIINIISIISPLKITEKNLILQNLTTTEKEILDKLFSESKYNQSEFIFLENNSISIKPDPISDIIRIHSIQENDYIKPLIKELIDPFSFRIISNLIVIQNECDTEIIHDALNEVWKDVTNRTEYNINYFDSLTLCLSVHDKYKFDLDLLKPKILTSSIDNEINEVNRDLFFSFLRFAYSSIYILNVNTRFSISLKFIQKIYDIYLRNEDESDIFSYLAQSVANITLDFGQAKIEDFESFDKIIHEIYNKSKDHEIRNSLIQSNANIIYHMTDTNKILTLFSELLNLTKTEEIESTSYERIKRWGLFTGFNNTLVRFSKNNFEILFDFMITNNLISIELLNTDSFGFQIPGKSTTIGGILSEATKIIISNHPNNFRYLCMGYQLRYFFNSDKYFLKYINDLLINHFVNANNEQIITDLIEAKKFIEDIEFHNLICDFIFYLDLDLLKQLINLRII